MKHPAIYLCLLLLCAALVLSACGGGGSPTGTDDSAEPSSGAAGPETTVPATEETQAPDNTPTPTAYTYSLTDETERVKFLGVRRLSTEGQINCDWTCSGLEMNVQCTADGDITFRASASANCYFRAYIDGQAWGGERPYYQVGTGTTRIVLKDVPAGRHTVRLIKVTGHTLARAQITEVKFCGNILAEKPADNDLCLEFVGDSICCGWGMIGTKDGTYTGQDGSLAYPYLVAQAMNADYSITALSGQGLLVGNPNVANGYLAASPLRESGAYSFERKADIVVVNIGTNDYGQREAQNITAEKFYQAYLNFLGSIKTQNGSGCRIVCVYNTMNDTFAESIQRAVSDAGGENVGIHLLQLSRTANPNNNGHPGIEEQAAYAETLTAFLRDLPEIPEVVDTSDACGMFVGWSQLLPY